jgi:hypothetical protein
MKKCGRPVRNDPTAMRKQPTAMSLGRCIFAPKWLTTARNSRLPARNHNTTVAWKSKFKLCFLKTKNSITVWVPGYRNIAAHKAILGV